MIVNCDPLPPSSPLFLEPLAVVPVLLSPQPSRSRAYRNQLSSPPTSALLPPSTYSLPVLISSPGLLSPPNPSQPGPPIITSPLTSGPPLLRGHPLRPAFISTLNSSQRPFSTPRPTRCRSSSPPRASSPHRPPSTRPSYHHEPSRLRPSSPAGSSSPPGLHLRIELLTAHPLPAHPLAAGLPLQPEGEEQDRGRRQGEGGERRRDG